MSCAVKGCKNVRRFKPDGIYFHRFPKGSLFTVWRNVLKLDEKWQWSANRFVCSKHFHNSDYLTVGNKLMLKPNAVPFVGKPHGFQAQTQVPDDASTPSTSSAGLARPVLVSEQSSVLIAADSSIKQVSQTSLVIPIITESCVSGGSRSNTPSDQPLPVDQIKRKRFSSVRLQKFKVEKLPGVGTDRSTSTDSSTKRKRSLKYIQFMHSLSTSPGKIKKKYTKLRETQTKARRKLYSAIRTIKSLNKKIMHLGVVVEDLKKNQALSEGAASFGKVL